MNEGRVRRLLVSLAAAITLAVALAAVFRAYQNPANVAQWLSLLQLCR